MSASGKGLFYGTLGYVITFSVVKNEFYCICGLRGIIKSCYCVIVFCSFAVVYNILRAAFLLILFCQKITKPSYN